MASYQLKPVNDLRSGDRLAGPTEESYYEVFAKSRHGNYCIVSAINSSDGYVKSLFFYRREECRVLADQATI